MESKRQRQRKTWRLNNEMMRQWWDVGHVGKRWCRATKWCFCQPFFLLCGLLLLWQPRQRVCHCVCACVFVSHRREHNTDLQPAYSAAPHLPSQLQPACGTASILASAKCHYASHSPSVHRSVPANRPLCGSPLRRGRCLLPEPPMGNKYEHPPCGSSGSTVSQFRPSPI